MDLTRGTEERYKIYVQNKGIALNDLHARAYTAKGIISTGSKQKREEIELARSWMCENFFDVRALGAVMNTQINCGQVRGPIQLTFARSVDPIVPLDLAITRVAIMQAGTDKQTEIGRKAIVPYALYIGYGYYVPHFAKQSGFSSEDLEVFWQAMQLMWNLDRSAARGRLTFRGLYIFTHDNPLGNAQAHMLLDRIRAERVESSHVPRCYGDYLVQIYEDKLPKGVTLTKIDDEGHVIVVTETGSTLSIES